MARKKVVEESKQIDATKMDQHMIDMPITDALTTNYMPYAMSVIVSRALPEIDGFKPAHRKLLYTMYLMRLQNKKIKSANIVGQTMQFNPHGDSSIYETMIRLSEGNETLLTPYVASKGNMGKHYSRDMAYAAYRYTEAGLTKISTELFDGINKNAVDMVDNYDGTKKEPVLLPVSFPNILAIPTLGIAVGMASNICSFNLKELCEATIEHIRHPKSDLLDIMPAPDFSTGGEIVYNKNEMKSIYQTGKGNIVIRSKYKVNPKKRIIEINEIPYTTSSEAIVDSVLVLCKSGKIKEIDDIRDDTDKNGMLITIEYKRSVDPDALMQKLFKNTPLQDTFSCNFNMLIDGKPRVLGVYEILDNWVKFRTGCIVRVLNHDVDAHKKELHLLKGLEKILANIDKAIKIIKNTEKDSEVVPNLMKAFKVDEIQGNYIADIKLRNINKEYILNRTKYIASLEAEIARLEKIISSDTEIKKIIIKKLQEIAKNNDYVKPRKTTINENAVVLTNNGSDNDVENYDIKLVITEHGYIKKIPAKSYKEDANIKMKDNDKIIKVLDAENIGDILVFTDKCNVYKCRLSEVADCKTNEFGEYVNNITNMESDENAIFITTTTSYEGNVVIGFENGKVCKYPLNVYATKTNRKKLVNAFFNGSKALSIFVVDNEAIFTMISSAKKKIIFNTELIPLKTTKTTQGVQTLRLSKGATAVSIQKIDTIAKKDEKFNITSIPAAGLVTK